MHGKGGRHVRVGAILCKNSCYVLQSFGYGALLGAK